MGHYNSPDTQRRREGTLCVSLCVWLTELWCGNRAMLCAARQSKLSRLLPSWLSQDRRLLPDRDGLELLVSIACAAACRHYRTRGFEVPVLQSAERPLLPWSVTRHRIRRLS